jgi:O-antigen/teichoic acid export membrane protein
MELMKRWLFHVRTSGRLAFLLRLAMMLPSSLLSLWWARALLHAMGPNSYGLFVAFQGVLGLAALGDLGMGGALLVRTSRLLANNQMSELQLLHATARSLYLGFAVGGLTLVILFSPWLPALFRFMETPASGSLATLFVAGGLYAFFVFLSGYYQTTLYAVGTVSWPVLPPVLVFHLGSAFQLICALHHAPLWLQMVPSVVLAAGCLLLYRQMMRASHVDLAGPFPLQLEPACVKALLQSSFWAYLFSISFCIYTATDRLMVNAGFGASRVTPYVLNFRLCDVALMLIIGVAFVAMPGVVARILNPDERQKIEGRIAAEKIRKIQTFLGCVASIFYLTVNDVFVRWWFGANTAVPLNLQAAFAFTLLLTAASDNAIQLWGRLSESGLRNGSIAAILSALVNLGLSYAAMSVGWIAGIAWATWVARAFFALFAIRAVCTEFQIPSRRWLVSVFIAPTIMLAASFFLIKWISPHMASQWLVLAGSNLVLIGLSFFLCGLRPSLFREELAALQSLIRGPREKG